MLEDTCESKPGASSNLLTWVWTSPLLTERSRSMHFNELKWMVRLPEGFVFREGFASGILRRLSRTLECGIGHFDVRDNHHNPALPAGRQHLR